MRRRPIFWGLLLWLASFAVAAAERHALVIGNAAYRGEPVLRNTVNDARDMAAVLKRLGYTVTTLENADGRALRRGIDDYLDRIRGSAGIAVLYYSGHGVQDSQRNNYLLPVDADVRQESHIRSDGVGLNPILEQLGQRPDGAVSLVILDACRNNPFSGGVRGVQKGLARVSAPPGGTLVLYAASPGQTADDNAGERNGLFTRYLLEYLPKTGLEVEAAFRDVALAVKRASGNRQVPYKEGNLLGRYSLAGEPSTAVAPPPPPGADHDLIAWQSAEKCGTAACFRAYLKTHPQGRYAELARARLEPAAGSVPPALAAEPTCCKLWVKATPADAQVRIMSIVPAYRDGIEVKSGKHRIRVERSGYEAYDQWVEINQAEQVVMVDLPKSAAPVVAERPAPARQGLEPEMVRISGGSFQMGSPASEVGRDSDERPHRVTVRDFALGKDEVTVGEFKRFVEATGHRTDAERNVGDAQGCWVWSDGDGQGSYRAGHSWRKPGYTQHDNYPVVCVSWNDAVAYTVWLNQETGQSYRLPTEAEWEYAARAGTTTARYWGNDPNQACRYANVADQAQSPKGLVWTEKHDCSDGYWSPAPVGRFRPNAWQLNDLLGNVWEWTCSLYDPDYGGAEQECNYKDTTGPRSLRGGSWSTPPAWVRSASRGWFTPSYRVDFTGFRLARSL